MKLQKAIRCLLLGGPGESRRWLWSSTHDLLTACPSMILPGSVVTTHRAQRLTRPFVPRRAARDAEERITSQGVSVSRRGGGVMKRIAFAILLALAALSATSVVWADSSTTSTVTTEAP